MKIPQGYNLTSWRSYITVFLRKTGSIGNLLNILEYTDFVKLHQKNILEQQKY